MSFDRGRLAALLALAIVVGLGVGGAASDPDGVWVSFSWSAGVAALVATAVVFRSTPLASLNGLWVAVGVVLLAGFFAPFRPLTGPPLLALAAAALALVVDKATLPWASRALLPACMLVYLWAAHQTQVRVGPRGDEPHYLMVTQSLILDRDLAIEGDYAQGRYRAYHAETLEPHYLVRGKNDTIYSLHAVGLSVLLVPAFLLGGYAGASFFMALIGVALVAVIRRTLRLLVDQPVAEGVAWAVALSPPLISYAGLVFTEVPAALAIACVLRLIASSGTITCPALWMGTGALAFLPWLHVRYALPAAVLGAALVLRRPHRVTVLAAATCGVLSAVALTAYHQQLYGFWNPAGVFGRRPRFAWTNWREGIPGLLLDQEFGLLIYAPAFVLFPLGVAGLWKRSRPAAVAAIVLVAAALALSGTWSMWRGGFNPPARFLVPAVPALTLGVAFAVQRRWNAPRAVLVGWGLWIGLAGASRPELIHRDREGAAPFFRDFSGGREWTSLLPRFVLPNDDRLRLATVWAAALVLAAAWRRGDRGPLALGGAVAGIAFAAAATSAVASPASTSGVRDAVRVLGQPAVRVGPKPAASLRNVATWTPGDAGINPVYEPHRAPASLVIADRLPLDPGRYTLSLAVEELGMTEKVDPLRPRQGIVVTARRDCGITGVPLAAGDGVLVASFTVSDTCRPISLSFISGKPLLLKRFSLARISHPPGPAR